MSNCSRMNRREAARLLLGSALAAGALRGNPPAARPNIVFVLMDDLRWDALGCAGHPFVRTPNIDRIAREGAMFENFFVTTPLCSPSRASIMTGRYVHAHGVTGNGNNNELSHRLVTWPRLLHDAGYETAFVGKWHMGTDDMPRPGFDRWISFKGQGVYNNPAINVDGKPEQMQGYITDILNGYAAEFVKRQHNKPFALYLGHKAVHGPFTPAVRHQDLYGDDPIPRRPNAGDTLEGKPALRREIADRPARQQAAQKAGKTSPPDNDQLIRNQLRALMAVDEGVGMLLKALEQTAQLDNTVLVFTSDNGYFWGEHGLGDKRWSYEESIRDPLVVRYPKLIQPGRKIQQDALNIDFAPTFLELAGVPAPKEVQGRSLVPLFRGQPNQWRKSFLIEYFAEQAFQRTPTWQGVRTARWKYTHYTELEGMDELYDLQADPYEMKNRIDDPAAAPALKQMKDDLQRLLKETS
jgi:arylsulfatase A-like enzyme